MKCTLILGALTWSLAQAAPLVVERHANRSLSSCMSLKMGNVTFSNDIVCKTPKQEMRDRATLKKYLDETCPRCWEKIARGPRDIEPRSADALLTADEMAMTTKKPPRETPSEEWANIILNFLRDCVSAAAKVATMTAEEIQHDENALRDAIKYFDQYQGPARGLHSLNITELVIHKGPVVLRHPEDIYAGLKQQHRVTAAELALFEKDMQHGFGGLEGLLIKLKHQPQLPIERICPPHQRYIPHCLGWFLVSEQWAVFDMTVFAQQQYMMARVGKFVVNELRKDLNETTNRLDKDLDFVIDLLDLNLVPTILESLPDFQKVNHTRHNATVPPTDVEAVKPVSGFASVVTETIRGLYKQIFPISPNGNNSNAS
ncbi:MAG: hypothetical protein M1818_001765 [Claussenomyces sp. TS43310]|nr:MAG: hypothetical protein M1818_001765 [Claussenomyces sp. TS43310]